MLIEKKWILKRRTGASVPTNLAMEGHGSPRAEASRRGMASVDAGLDLGLPGKFGHFIGSEFVEPRDGQYFDNLSPLDGLPFIQAAQGTKADVDRAVEAAKKAFASTWSKASVTARSNMLLKMADIVEKNADRLAKIETLDNGKAIRESSATDLPLAIDHLRYFAGVIRAEEGSASEIDADTLSLCVQEPLGVVGQIIPWCAPRGERAGPCP